MLIYLIPVFILAAVVIVLGLFALLGRIKGGKYLRPIMQFLMKVPILGNGLKKMSEAALERSDPELASAVKKLERMGAINDPQRAQQAMSSLSAAERKAVMDATMQHELFAAIEERSIEAVSPLVATSKCAQIANGFLYDAGNEDPVAVHSVKIDWLRELVESLDGEPLLIAYEFIEDLRTIRRAFGAVPVLGNPTPAREAKQLIEDWNAGKLPLLALHPASAGHGLNLQYGGSRMAWLSPSWSAELTEQAIARIYRPGQTQHVTIHVCVAAGTVDEMKRDRVIGKMSAQEAFRRHLERV